MGRDEGKMTSNDVPVLWLNQPINSDWVRVCILGVCLDLTVNFHHEHPIVPANCPWVSEDAAGLERWNVGKVERRKITLALLRRGTAEN